MTISPITRTSPNAGQRTAAATEAKMRKSEERWAEHLRGRGWAVIDPDHVAALGRLVAEYAAAHRVPVADLWGALAMTTPDAS
jgi:hypothetical protein